LTSSFIQKPGNFQHSRFFVLKKLSLLDITIVPIVRDWIIAFAKDLTHVEIDTHKHKHISVEVEIMIRKHTAKWSTAPKAESIVAIVGQRPLPVGQMEGKLW
jgi:hypothetical protein